VSLSPERLRAACTWLAAALAFQLPAELTTPLLRIGPISISNIEATGYLLLLAWLAAIASRALPRPRLPTWAVVAIGVFLVGGAISAAVALYDPGAAAKAMVRLAVALAIGMAAASVVLSGEGRWRWVAVAGLVGAVVSAVAGLIEYVTGWQALGGVFQLFRDAPISIGGFGTRATGTLLHPNLAGWYWGIAAVAAISAALLRQGVARIVLLLAGALLLLAVVLTLSRGALIGIFVATLVASVLIARARGRWLSPASLALVLPLPVIALAGAVASPLIATRLTSETDIEWYRFSVSAPATVASETGELTIPIEVTNRSPIAWPPSGPGSVVVSYHVLRPGGTYSDYEGRSTRLVDVLDPGETVAVDARVAISGGLSEALVEWDLRQVGATWFSLRLPAALSETHVEIAEPGAEPAEAGEPPPDESELELLRSQSLGRSRLWTIAMEMIVTRPIIGIGFDNFRHGYGEWRGMGAWDTTVNTNNLYLEMLVGVGVIALALASVVVAAGIRLLRAAPFTRPGPQALWLVTLVALLVHGVLDSFVVFSTALYLTAFAVMGGLMTRKPGDHSSP
jgi:hypothetical protein